jgi:hypothetical protein
MADSFNFVGKIALGKDSDKFHPIDRREFQSGWMSTTVRFNCISGTNRVLCMIQGGKWNDDKKNVIKTYSKSTTDANGNVTKGEKIDISWQKRFDADQIDKVAGFRRFVCDTGDARLRYKLQDVVDGKASIDDDLIAAGIDSVAAAKTALEKSNAKRKIFLSEWDFAEHMAKVAASDKFKNKLFRISGNYDVSYNAENDRFYTNYHVNRVALVPDDAEFETELKIDFYFGEDAWDDSQYDETGKCIVNGWVSYYDNNVSKNGFMPISVAVKEDAKKAAALKRKFNVDDEIKQIGLTLKVVEGAEVVEITMDMLDDETREDIECGLLDFEEVKRSLGGRAVGDRISELRYTELTPKKNVAQETAYTLDDMHAARVELTEETEEENFDIFDEDDDL